MKRMMVLVLALVLGSAFGQTMYGLNLGMTRVQVHNVLTKNNLLLTLIQDATAENEYSENWVYTKAGPDAYPLGSGIHGDSTSVTFDANHQLSRVHMSVASRTPCETYTQFFNLFVEKYGKPATQDNYRSQNYMGVTSCADLNTGLATEEVRFSATWYRMNSSGEVLNTVTLRTDMMWEALEIYQEAYNPWNL